jgi:hypothetical protein
MPRQDDVGVHRFQERQGGKRLLTVGVEHIWEELRPVEARGRMGGDQSVPADEDAEARQMVGAVATRVPQRVDGYGRAGQIQCAGCGGRRRIGEGPVCRPARADGVHVPARLPGARHGQHLAHRHLVQELASGVRHLLLVHENPGAVRGADALGSAYVVGVGVGHQDGGHIPQFQLHGGQRGEHSGVITW